MSFSSPPQQHPVGQLLAASLASTTGILIWIIALYTIIPMAGVACLRYVIGIDSPATILFAGLTLPAIVWAGMVTYVITKAITQATTKANSPPSPIEPQAEENTTYPPWASLLPCWGVVATPPTTIALTVTLGLLAMACWAGLLTAIANSLHLATPSPLFASNLLSIPIIVALTVVNPTLEEFLFRGALQGSFSQWLGKFPHISTRRFFSPLLAIIVTAIVFTLLHGGYWSQPLAAINTFALAIGLGLCRHWTRSIWAGLLLHIINNSLVVAQLTGGLG